MVSFSSMIFLCGAGVGGYRLVKQRRSSTKKSVQGKEGPTLLVGSSGTSYVQIDPYPGVLTCPSDHPPILNSSHCAAVAADLDLYWGGVTEDFSIPAGCTHHPRRVNGRPTLEFNTKSKFIYNGDTTLICLESAATPAPTPVPPAFFNVSLCRSYSYDFYWSMLDGEAGDPLLDKTCRKLGGLLETLYALVLNKCDAPSQFDLLNLGLTEVDYGTELKKRRDEWDSCMQNARATLAREQRPCNGEWDTIMVDQRAYMEGQPLDPCDSSCCRGKYDLSESVWHSMLYCSEDPVAAWAEVATRREQEDTCMQKAQASRFPTVACASPGHSSNPACTLSNTGHCIGMARYGKDDKWSHWQSVSGQFECSMAFFDLWREDDPSMAKECQCSSNHREALL